MAIALSKPDSINVTGRMKQSLNNQLAVSIASFSGDRAEPPNFWSCRVVSDASSTARHAIPNSCGTAP